MSLLGLIGLTSALFISADLASNSYALDSTVGLESKVTATVDGTHYVSLTASDTTFTITPTNINTPTTDTQTVNVSVETNAVGGASLYLASTTNTNALYKDGNPTNSNLPHIAASTATVESPTTLDNLSPNTWAYSTDNTNYQGVPTNSDTNSPNLIADINGTTTGTTSGGVTSATIPIYYAAKIDTSIPAGSYASSVTYSAVVDGGIVTSAELTSITVDNESVEAMQAEAKNVILVTTNLKTNTYGTPRVYYTATDPSGYQECGNVVVGSNNEGYMTVTCAVTPTTEATGVTLHIVPKGSQEDKFCTDGTYQQDTSECECGDWKWGSFTVSLPNIIRLRNMSEISTMQEMTPEFCASVTDKAPGNTARLQDTRDDKYYWVAKLKDGNCWMTQNLDLDLTTGVELTPEDSDVSANWDPGATTYDTYRYGGTYDHHTVVQSWSLGGRDQLFVWSDASITSSCNYETSTCSNWTNVTNLAPMTSIREDGVIIDGSTYDAHYLAGNYYSWEAATAGTGSSATSSGSKAADSICPAGWQLPQSGSSSSSSSLCPYSFYALVTGAYGITSSNNPTDISKAPLYFVRAGFVAGGNNLFNAGSSGAPWSSIAESSGSAYNLYFNSSTVDASDSSNTQRYYGLSVRCMTPSA